MEKNTDRKQENIIITEQRRLKEIPENKRKELAKLIATNDNWRNIGLYFEQEYYFKISEADLKARHPPGTPALHLCEDLIEDLAKRNVSIQSFTNVLNNPNIGMNGIVSDLSNLILGPQLKHCYFIICSTTISDEEYDQLVQAINDMDDTKEIKSLMQWDIITKMMYHKKEQLINVKAFQQNTKLIIITKLKSKPFRAMSRITKIFQPPNMIIVDSYQNNQNWMIPKLLTIGQKRYKSFDIADHYIKNWKREECKHQNHSIAKTEEIHFLDDSDISSILSAAPGLDYFTFVGPYNGDCNMLSVGCFLSFWLDTHKISELSTDSLFPSMIKVPEENATLPNTFTAKYPVACSGTLKGSTIFFFLTTVSSYWSMLFEREQCLQHFYGLTVMTIEPLTRERIVELMKSANEESNMKLNYLKLFCENPQEYVFNVSELFNENESEKTNITGKQVTATTGALDDSINISITSIFNFSFMNEKLCTTQGVTEEQPHHFICLSDHPQFFTKPPNSGSVPLGLAITDFIWWKTTLNISFLDQGTEFDSLKEKVRQSAHRWTEVANINFNYVPNPADSDIRISFTHQPGKSWSFIGQSALNIGKDQPTMNLGWLTAETPQKEIDRVVRHEFGHALGLVHEHQHPHVAFDWNVPQIMQSLGWTEDEVRHNILKKYDPATTKMTVTSYDPKSIMHYWFDPSWTVTGVMMPENTDLSEGDIKIIQKEYGKRQ